MYAPEKLPGKKLAILSAKMSPPNLKVWRPRIQVAVSANWPRLMLVKRGLKKLRPTTSCCWPPLNTVACGLMLLDCPGSLSRM